MSEISITHSPDGLKGFLLVPDGIYAEYPTVDELKSLLAANGIVSGIDTAALQRMVAENSYNFKVEVAHGDPPIDGKPGRIEILVDIASRGKPRALPGGRVDHRDLGYVVNVRKEAPILRRVPPIPGTDGITVLGTTIGCRQAPALTLIPGPGTRYSPEDPDLLIADRDGAVAVFSNGKAAVLDQKTVGGDIDYATGNINFMGNLQVRGTVRAGFEVEAEGNVMIGGSVEDAKVTAGGDLEVLGGATGSGNGQLKCGGTLKARHCQNFIVHAVSIDVAEDMVHCTVWAEGSLTAKAIVGGTISAGKSMTVETIGTSAEPRTVIDLGGMSMLLDQKYGLLKDLAAVTAETGSIRGAMYHVVKDEMDDQGMLPPGALARLEALKAAGVQSGEKSGRIQKDIEALDEKLKEQTVPVLRAKTVFPNTLIKAGSTEKQIKTMLSGVVISIDKNAITIERG